MAFRAPLVNFSKGEISEALFGRFDTAAYQAGLAKARNVVVKKEGGVTNRPGFRYVAELYNTTGIGRLIPFQFSVEQSYALAFEQALMRVATNGGLVLEDGYRIMGATQANPVVLHIPYHPYAVGDEIFLSGITGMVELNGRTIRVMAVPDGDHITTDVNGLSFAAFINAPGGTLPSGPPTPPPTPPTVPPVVPPDAPPVTAPPVGDGTGGGGITDYDRPPNYQIP